MTDRLKGKLALITGTGSGIGRAAALLFAREGATIVSCDINAERDKETVKLVEETGGHIHSTAPLDLAEPGRAEAWVEDTIARFGRIDVLYNNVAAQSQDGPTIVQDVEHAATGRCRARAGRTRC